MNSDLKYQMLVMWSSSCFWVCLPMHKTLSLAPHTFYWKDWTFSQYTSLLWLELTFSNCLIEITNLY